MSINDSNGLCDSKLSRTIITEWWENTPVGEVDTFVIKINADDTVLVSNDLTLGAAARL
jgi:hypothetical protein